MNSRLISRSAHLISRRSPVTISRIVHTRWNSNSRTNPNTTSAPVSAAASNQSAGSISHSSSATSEQNISTDTAVVDGKTPGGRPALTLAAFSMEGKVAMITGAARGLGYEFCNALIQAGCTKLAIVDLKESEAQAAAAEIVAQTCARFDRRPEDYTVIGIECDVSSERSVQKAYSKVMDTFGRIDAVVASAGIVENYSAFDYPFDRIKRLYDINVHGAFFTAREAARHMIPQGGGSIILIASMSANIVNIPQPQTPYNASKAAVKHMAASLGVEWAKKNVRVNSISPGYMLTKLTKTILEHEPDLKKTWESLTPMGRMGEPEDLAGAVVFLASDASRFMTGSEIRVDGGYTVV